MTDRRSRYRGSVWRIPRVQRMGGASEPYHLNHTDPSVFNPEQFRPVLEEDKRELESEVMQPPAQ